MSGGARLVVADCLDALRDLPDASVDAVVSDPPYELGFMGKGWDGSGIAYNVALWRDVLRVLKPGGHLLAFGGTRTYHRLACAIEDAGFEIRDSIHWVYGSGFPKSLDVSKAIDKQRHDRDDIYRVTAWIRQARDAAGITNRDIDAAFGANGMGRHWTDVPPTGLQPAVPTMDQVPTLLAALRMDAHDVPGDIWRLLWDLNGIKGQPGENWAKREVLGVASVPVGHAFAGPVYGGDSSSHEVPVTAPATDDAARWQGWGTALKPAHEPIVVARKPLAGTVAQTVLAHGTGAINVDGCRVGTGEDRTPGGVSGSTASDVLQDGFHRERQARPTEGRWPPNFILTHAEGCEEACVKGCPADFDESRFFPTFRYQAKASRRERNEGLEGMPERDGSSSDYGTKRVNLTRKDQGENRVLPTQNHHPTVKPVELMRWLVRLVTPPGGVVLDPFTGSGTTGVAAVLEGFDFIGIEREPEYAEIAERRIAHARAQAEAAPEQLAL